MLDVGDGVLLGDAVELEDGHIECPYQCLPLIEAPLLQPTIHIEYPPTYLPQTQILSRQSIHLSQHHTQVSTMFRQNRCIEYLPFVG